MFLPRTCFLRQARDIYTKNIYEQTGTEEIGVYHYTHVFCYYLLLSVCVRVCVCIYSGIISIYLVSVCMYKWVYIGGMILLWVVFGYVCVYVGTYIGTICIDG